MPCVYRILKSVLTPSSRRTGFSPKVPPAAQQLLSELSNLSAGRPGTLAFLIPAQMHFWTLTLSVYGQFKFRMKTGEQPEAMQGFPGHPAGRGGGSLSHPRRGKKPHQNTSLQDADRARIWIGMRRKFGATMRYRSGRLAAPRRAACSLGRDAAPQSTAVRKQEVKPLTWVRHSGEYISVRGTLRSGGRV
ncbi:hypothetical protein GOODEAATRI_027635 [Goodea atripinnis]|uniref:Uncharacterized protein n=1 Tax=Goodea atripinnis TaxID=208336 RepID=A0ABV0NY86_9TELE